MEDETAPLLEKTWEKKLRPSLKWLLILVPATVFIIVGIFVYCCKNDKPKYADFYMSTADHNTYREIKLSNGLIALVIHSPESERSGAAMSIGSGSNQEKIPGMAHFLEHMLFYSSEEFPVEDYFRSYIEQHGGSTNAYTDKDETNFYFYVNKDYFKHSLRVFSRFFIDPIFK